LQHAKILYPSHPLYPGDNYCPIPGSLRQNRPQGATGPAGPQGSAGLQGTGGSQGAAGPAGSQIFEGNGVPTDTLGNVGDFYINAANDSLYRPKTLSGWGKAISLQGTAGAAGAPGTQGAPGATGSTGATGSAGATGVAGTGIDPHQLTYKQVCTKYGIQP